MLWLTSQEQRTLAVLALVGVAGLAVLLWPPRSGALTIAQAPAAREAVQWDAALQTSRQIDVNTAGIAELERLPEVGPSLARRIVAYRETHGPFSGAEGLQRVPGIGPKTYDVLKDYVRTE